MDPEFNFTAAGTTGSFFLSGDPGASDAHGRPPTHLVLPRVLHLHYEDAEIAEADAVRRHAPAESVYCKHSRITPQQSRQPKASKP